MASRVCAMAFYQHSCALRTVNMSLHIKSVLEPSEPAILSSLKKLLLQFLTETLGRCNGDHVRMCQSGTLAKAGFLPPSLFAP